MKDDFDILVAGGGLVGLTAAALLAGGPARGRLRLRVVDGGPRPRFDAAEDVSLRVSALSPGTVGLCRSLGAWQRVPRQRACAFRTMRVWDAARDPFGPEALCFDAAEFAVPELGHIVENVVVQDALLAVLEDAGVDLDFGCAISDVHAAGDRFVVALADGRELAPDLVVAADGSGSKVRGHAGIAVTSWRYPQAAFVTHLVPERPHRDCAWQRFLPEGPLALLPLHDGRVSVVWTSTQPQARTAAAASEEELGEMLTGASDGVLGRLRVSGPRASFPLRAQYAAEYVRPGLALIGDAAHSIHPLAGQGANLGIADAGVLADVVTRAVAAGEHPGDRPVLRRFERSRKGANQAMLYFVDTLNRLFASPSPPVTRLRNAGMRIFNHSGPLRRRAVALALGTLDAGKR